MGNSFRNQPLPTLYADNKTPVSEDLLEVGLLVAFAMIAFSFILIIPGIRGWERLFATLRVAITLFVGAVILVSNFGYGWYTDTVSVQTQYRAFTTEEIVADIGLHIGLRGINITLKGVPLDLNGDLAGETINYNEQFWWANPWAQGRVGFGRYSGRINQEFRAAQYRGMPYPILWVAEYFTLDGEQIRWARKFRQAGWYAHQFLWLAFAIYLLTILTYIWNIRYGIHFTMLLGVIMICACFSYGLIILNSPHIRLPWNRAHCEPDPGAGEWCATAMVPHFGWSWGLVLATGISVFVLGAVLYIVDFFIPRWTAPLFHHNLIEADEEFLTEETEGEEEGYSGESYRGRSRGGGRTTRGRTTRGRTLNKYRQTQRRPRATLRSGGGSQRLKNDIPLEEITVVEKSLEA